LFLSFLKNLFAIKFQSNKVKFLRSLKNLTHLEYIVDLRFNQIESIKVLERLAKLTNLFLDSNRIETQDGLEKLINLVDLRLINNNIKILTLTTSKLFNLRFIDFRFIINFDILSKHISNYTLKS
jgi:hypothetical protein